MIRKASFCAIYFSAALMAAYLMSSCNSDSSNTYSTLSYNSTAVTSFSLQSNSKVLNNLDSVFFSINLDNATIFNASPLPLGTKVDALLINLTTDNCSVVELNFLTKYGNDTTINYLNNTTDSINFANGPVDLRVVSYDGESTRNYSIAVNVFKENPDSMVWRQQSTKVPSTLTPLLGVKAIEAGNAYYCLSYDGSTYELQKSEDLYDFDNWKKLESFDLSLVNGRQLNSFTGSDNGNLYILDADDVLWESTDEGNNWSSTEVVMKWIYGCYNDEVLGSYYDATGSYSVTYPGGERSVQASDFPVKSTSTMALFSSQWEVNPIAVFVGGLKADGDMSADTWGYDGRQWAKISSGTLAPNMESSLFHYKLATVNTNNWRTYYQPVLFKIGGSTSGSTSPHAAYYSVDMGLHWEEAPFSYQISAAMPDVENATVLVSDHLLDVGYSWGTSRAIAPVTSWECPFLYVYGGYDAGGDVNTEIWQGVVLRYTLTPLQ